MPKLPTKPMEQLYRAVLELRTEEECAAFFEDLCTITEVQDMARRLDAAILLEQGMPYQKIAKEADISTATISRVSRCIQYGAGGYRTVIERLKAREKT